MKKSILVIFLLLIGYYSFSQKVTFYANETKQIVKFDEKILENPIMSADGKIVTILFITGVVVHLFLEEPYSKIRLLKFYDGKATFVDSYKIEGKAAIHHDELIGTLIALYYEGSFITIKIRN